MVVGADHVYRMDPQQMIDHHVTHRAGVTVAAIPVPRDEASAFGIVNVGKDGRTVSEFLEKPADPPRCREPGDVLRVDGQRTCSTPTCSWTRCARTPRRLSRHDIGGNIIPMLVRDGCAQAYDFALNRVPGASRRTPATGVTSARSMPTSTRTWTCGR